MTFREYLREANLSQEKAKEFFGKELFGEFLNKDERDTKYEERAFNEIKRFVSANKTSPELFKFLKVLRDSKIHFPDILKPDVKTVYRGSGIPHDEVPDYSKLKPQKKGKDSVFVINNYTYIPQGEIQSYTKSYKIASEEFSVSTLIGNTPVIYEVKVNDDFLFSTKLTNEIADTVGHDKEYEILRISDKPIKCKLYILNPEF